MLEYHSARWNYLFRSWILPKEVFGLPNIKSAKKRVLIAEERNARNKAEKSALKTAIKKFEVAAAEGNRTEADGAYKVAVKDRKSVV